MILRFLILCVLCLTAHATDYYVRSDGNDGNTGTADTAGGAWLTIQHAASTIVAGDTVNIRTGTFNEFVTPAASGTAGNPITFVGTLSGTNCVTIIDPSSDVSTGWAAAPEIGSGVYKRSGFSVRTGELTISGKRVGRIWNEGDITSDIDAAYDSSGYTTGFGLLTVPTAQVFFNNLGGFNVHFWEGVEALYISAGTGSTFTNYLRLRDGSDPNGLTIRAAQNDIPDLAHMDSIVNPTFTIGNKSYLTFRNLQLRGSFCPFHVYYSDHIIIESNYLAGGYARIRLAGTTNCTIRGNFLTTDWYGGPVQGAWEGGTSSQESQQNCYLIGKYIMGHTAQNDYGVKVDELCVSNSIVGNTFTNTLNDTILLSDTTYSSIVASNIIGNCSAHGIYSLRGITNTTIFDNLIYYGNIGLRFGYLNDVAYETSRELYVYRNRFVQPVSGVGEHIFFHTTGATGSTVDKVLWIYQNSFSGGRRTFYFSPDYIGTGGLPGVSIVNNISSDCQYYYANSTDFITNPSGLALFDYNVVTPPWPTFPTSDDPDWFAAHNIKSATNFWTTAPGMSFALSAGSVAIDAGKNLPVTNPTLPQDGTVKVGAGWDIGALEFGSPGQVIIRNIVARNLRINNVVP